MADLRTEPKNPNATREEKDRALASSGERTAKLEQDRVQKASAGRDNKDIPPAATEEAIENGEVMDNPNPGESFEDQQRRGEEEKKKNDEIKGTLKKILDSNEGYVVRGESDDFSDLESQGLVYMSAVQSGPGGLEVEERYYLTQSGYDKLK